MPFKVILLLISISVCSASFSYGQAWQQFRGADFGRTSETNVATKWNDENIDWKTPLPGRGASSPVVFGGHVYLTAYTGYAVDKKEPGDQTKLVRHLICLDVVNGEILWQVDVPDETPKDKFSSWGTAKAGYASGSAAVDESGVYVLFGASGVLAVDHQGAELWRANCGDEVHEYPAGNSPVIYKDLVIVNASYESGSLIALNKFDGTETWRQDGIEESWNTPVVYRSNSGEDEVAIAIKEGIVAFDPTTGDSRWNCTGFDDYICPSIIEENGILYGIGGRSSKGIAVRSGGEGDVTETERLWLMAKGANVSSPVYSDGHLYWGKDKGGVVFCASAETGEVVYQERLKPAAGEIYATPLLANGKLYYLSREKGIFVVAAKPEFELLDHTQFKDEKSLFGASPAVLPGGAVLIRSDNFLYRMLPENKKRAP